MKLSDTLIEGLLPEEETKQTTALYAGGFKPPTSGHFEVVKTALEQNPEIDELIIFVGAKERDGISQDESMLIWDIYKQYLPLKVKIEPSSKPPIKAVYNFAKEHPTREILWVIGAREGNEEDFKDITSRTKSMTNYPNIELRTIITKGGVSGTAARNAAKISLDKFKKFIPDQLTDEEKQQVFDLVSSNMQEILNEDASYSNHIDYKQKIKDLTQHMIDKGMNIVPLPKVRFVHSDSSNAKDFFGKTAYYDPNNQEIVLYTEGRHPKDIVRSFSHEMIHHEQNLEGRLGDIQTTNTQEDDHLDQIEQEANLKGTMTFRNWTDTLNEISLPKATQQISRLNPEVDAKEVAKDFIRLSPNLDKKDLFQYKTYDELEQELKKASLSKSQRRKQAKSMDLEDNKFIFYKDDNFIIYKLDNPSQHPESCEIAQGAKICVASNSKKYWNQYMIDNDGVLFYIRNKNYDIPHPESIIAFMFPRKGLKIGYTEMVDYNDDDFISHGNYKEQKEYLSSIGIPTNIIEKMFKFIPDVKSLSYYIKNYKGKKKQFKVDGKTYFFYNPFTPPPMEDPIVFEDENGKVIGIIKPKGNVNKLSPIEKKWLKFRFPDLPDSVIYDITNVNKYWEENSKEVNLYNVKNNKLIKVGKAHLPYGPEEIKTFMSGNNVEVPDAFKNKIEEKTKDPFGLNAYAMELARLREDEEQPWKIYLDLDGVLADFDQRFKDLSGMMPREFEDKYGKNAFWDFIDEGDNKIKFWVGIPVMQGAKQLVDFAKDYNYELLTAPSLKKQSLIGKTVWVKKHTGDLFPTKPKINFKAAKNKHLIKPELTKYDILVDDRASTIDNWNNAGGTGILYKNTGQAIKDLKKIVL